MSQNQQVSGGTAEDQSWWYSAGGAAVGPVTWEQLVSLARESALGPGEHVRREDWSEWQAAMHVLPAGAWPAEEALPAMDARDGPADAVGGEAPASGWGEDRSTASPQGPAAAEGAPRDFQGPAGIGAIPYRAAPVHGSVVAGATTLDLLRRTVLWARIAAIGLLVIAGISGVVLAVILVFERDLESTLMALIGAVVIVAWYAVPGVLLLGFAAAASRTWRQRNPADLEQAVCMQYRLWKYLVILSAVFIVGYFALIVIALGLAL